jgi:Glycosyl hydrolases family 25
VIGSVKGVDVSSWAHPNSELIDWDAVADDGYSFALVKVTQGIGYTNPWGLRDLDDARAAGLLVGAYHYFEPGAPAADQAGFFGLSLVGQLLDVGAWLDWGCYPPVQFTYNPQLDAFMQEAYKARPQCGLRTSSAWLDQLTGLDVLKGRIWVTDDGWPAGIKPYLYSEDQPKPVEGISGPVPVCMLAQVRGVNIPTAPKPRPNPVTAVTVHPNHDPEPEPEPTPAEPELEGASA